jgi:hypothetical protein
MLPLLAALAVPRPHTRLFQRGGGLACTARASTTVAVAIAAAAVRGVCPVRVIDKRYGLIGSDNLPRPPSTV